MQPRRWIMLTLSLALFLCGHIMAAASLSPTGLPHPCDVNGDNVIDLLDLVAISIRMGELVPAGTPEDTNEDGRIDLFDLVYVSIHFETEASVAPSVGAPVVKIEPCCSQFGVPANNPFNLNEEYVCFQHVGGAPVDMTGWHVKDVQNHKYTFPSFTLALGAQVRLHTGSGTDTSTDLYWGLGKGVWNNLWHGGDTVFLYDDAWVPKDQYTYVSVAPGACIGAEDVWDYLGQDVCVEYYVVRTHKTENEVFLDSLDSYEGHFYVYIHSDKWDCWPVTPDLYFDEKWVRVQGTLRDYHGSPQIVLGDCGDIQILR